MDWIIYEVAYSNGAKRFRVFTTGLESACTEYATLSQLAQAMRVRAWEAIEKKISYTISWEPRGGIEQFYNQLQPVRCTRVSLNDQQLFWEIFKLSKEEAERRQRSIDQMAF